MVRIVIFFSLFVSVIFSCSGFANKKRMGAKKIKQLTLYNTMAEELNTDIKDLSTFKSKMFNDSATVALLSNSVRVSGNYIWKGYIIGVIQYENGESVKIRISRYGGFFKSFSDNKYYSFPDQQSIETWKNLVDTFVAETVN